MNLTVTGIPVSAFLKRHRIFWCGEMCIWVVSVQTKTPGYPCPRQKFTKRIFSPEKFPPTHTALGFVNIRSNADAGSLSRSNAGVIRSCRNSMLMRVDGNKNKLVAMPKTTKTFNQPLIPLSSMLTNYPNVINVMLA
jgi:hypothetical protein